MKLTYRAAIYRNPETGQETVLTGVAQSAAPAPQLLRDALEEAYRADIIGEEYPRVAEATFLANLYIGDWTEG